VQTDRDRGGAQPPQDRWTRRSRLTRACRPMATREALSPRRTAQAGDRAWRGSCLGSVPCQARPSARAQAGFLSRSRARHW